MGHENDPAAGEARQQTVEVSLLDVLHHFLAVHEIDAGNDGAFGQIVADRRIKRQRYIGGKPVDRDRAYPIFKKPIFLS